MCEFILSMLAVVHVFCQSRSDTAIEVLAPTAGVARPARAMAKARPDSVSAE
jgi:hypothetical protein